MILSSGLEGGSLSTHSPASHDQVDVELISKLDDALKNTRYASILQGVPVVTDYQAKPSIKARPEDVLDVFVNVMTNAIHAMDRRGTLSIGTARVGDKARVSISDTGCGIWTERVDRIFEPFVTTKSPERRTGVGHYDVLNIVTTWHGTTFHLDFPKA